MVDQEIIRSQTYSFTGNTPFRKISNNSCGRFGDWTHSHQWTFPATLLTGKWENDLMMREPCSGIDCRTFGHTDPTLADRKGLQVIFCTTMLTSELWSTSSSPL